MYSIIGAAIDYTPLREYLNTAIQEERRRLIREKVLSDKSVTPYINDLLGDIESVRSDGLRPDSIVLSLIGKGVFDGVQTAQSVKQDIPSLSISNKFIVNDEYKSNLQKLRVFSRLWKWNKEFRELANERGEELQKKYLSETEFAQIWGVDYYGSSQWLSQTEGTPDDMRKKLALFQETTWSMRRFSNPGHVPRLLLKVMRSCVHIIASRPNGISILRDPLNKLCQSADKLRNAAVKEYAKAKHENEDVKEKIAKWESDLPKRVQAHPFDAAILARVIPLIMLFVFALGEWLLLETPAPIAPDDLLLAGCLVAFGMLIPCIAVIAGILRMRLYLNNIVDTRISYTKKQMEEQGNAFIKQNLWMVYDRLLRDLDHIQSSVMLSLDHLAKWSVKQDPPSIPPDSVPKCHLRWAHMSKSVWEAVKHVVSTAGREVDLPEGPTQMSIDDAFLHYWQKDWNEDQNKDPLNANHWMDNGYKIRHQIRQCLEHQLNLDELREFIIPLQAKVIEAFLCPDSKVIVNETDKYRDRSLLDMAKYKREITHKPGEIKWVEWLSTVHQQGRWCPFRRIPYASVSQPGTCTACGVHNGNCAFSQVTADNQVSLDRFMKLRAIDGTGQLLPWIRPNKQKMLILEGLIKQCNIEKMLFSVGNSVGRPRVGVDQFTDDIIARAKPSGNFEMAESLDVERLSVELGVTELVPGETSALSDAFERRRIPLLSSQDPLSISMLRTLHNLRLGDLNCADRTAKEYFRLHSSDIDCISLITAETPADQEAVDELYGRADDMTIKNSSPIVGI